MNKITTHYLKQIQRATELFGNVEDAIDWVVMDERDPSTEKSLTLAIDIARGNPQAQLIREAA